MFAAGVAAFLALLAADLLVGSVGDGTTAVGLTSAATTGRAAGI